MTAIQRFGILLLLLTQSSLGWAQLNLTLLGQQTYTRDLSDVWGYAKNGREYALVGTFDGVSIVDVTDPAAPQELLFIDGPETAWRDLFVWQDHAYVVNEGGEGLLIIDLAPLPAAPTWWDNYTGQNFPFTLAHNLFIDEQGYAYILGADGIGGMIVLDLTDPKNPAEVTNWDQLYIHDATVQGDTLWASFIDEGEQGVFDISDRTSPTLVASWETPGRFAHNSWISDDNRFLYTTDEVSQGQVAAYNVVNINNPRFLDSYQDTSKSGVVPHNVHFLNEFLFVSYYHDGLIVLDASRPSSLVEVGRFDTSPQLGGNGMGGCWGVYPNLPSGNILASDRENGLFIFSFNPVRACQLSGEVKSTAAGNPPVIIPSLRLLGENIEEDGNLSGQFSMGTVNPGTYQLEASKTNYQTDTVSVTLVNGQLTQVEIFLELLDIGVDDPQRLQSAPRIYPNPVAVGEPFTIELNQQKTASLSLIDLQGRMLETQVLSEGQTQISWKAPVAPGQYVLRLTTYEGFMHHHFIQVQ